jgi:hypothetical protein
VAAFEIVGFPTEHREEMTWMVMRIHAAVVEDQRREDARNKRG